MTERKSFKRLVRARMDKTGESYTAARASLLDGKRGEAPVLPFADETVQRRTGHGWEAWFDLLDEAGADDWEHKDIARWIVEQHGIGGWWAQSVTVGYERARGRRALYERPEGFSATASKTVAVAVEQLFDAVVDDELRERWLPDGELRLRTASRPRSARFDWADGATRVNVGFSAKGEAKSTVAVEHERLADTAEAERMKGYWRERVATLKQELEQ